MEKKSYRKKWSNQMELKWLISKKIFFSHFLKKNYGKLRENCQGKLQPSHRGKKYYINNIIWKQGVSFYLKIYFFIKRVKKVMTVVPDGKVSISNKDDTQKYEDEIDN